ncbi:uncharacterized protein EHS24_006599 [Apiotrichum porosum]|uniref:Uncharacterized protein n=1 Tax=Apiotrichum porosum TaxID=105984 RepID=A0A427Y1I2_9TREE|nr:uncharacterized protein EHS24_006599 [Apiotrichum porosum]RSH85014.1 hypothetical protein EHS24_006599 [Apiotrichum porosum]
MSTPCTPPRVRPEPSTPYGKPHLATARELFRRMIQEDNGCSSAAPMHSPPLTPGMNTDPFATPKIQRSYTLGPAASIPIPATPVFNLARCKLAGEVKPTLPCTPPPTNERVIRVQRCPTTPVKLGSPVRLASVPMTPPSRRVRLANPPPLVRSKSTFCTPLYRPIPPPVCMLATPTTRPDSRVLLDRIAKLEHMVLGLQRQVAEHKTTTSRRPRKAAVKPLQKRRMGRVRLGQVM